MSEHYRSGRDYDPTQVTTFFESQRFTEALSYVNSRLAAFSDPSEMTPEQAQEEENLINDFSKTFFGPYWLDRETRATCIAAADPESNELNIHAAEGSFKGLTVESYTTNQLVDSESVTYVGDISARMLAIYLESDDEVYTVPLDTSCLLSLEVDIPPLPSGGDTLLSNLLVYEHVAKYLASRLPYQDWTEEKQSQQVRDILNEINTNQHMVSANLGPAIVTIGGNDGVSDVTCASLSVELPPSGNIEHDGLYLELFHPETSGTTSVPLARVLAFKEPIPENDNLQQTDLLHTFFADFNIINIINDSENWVNSLQDEDERNEAIAEAISDLNGLLSETFAASTFFATGIFYYAQPDSDDLIARHQSIMDGSAESFDIQFIDNKWRAVIPIEYEVNGYSQLAYVVPGKPHTEQLTAYYDTALDFSENEDDSDVIQSCLDAADATKHTVNSRAFKKASAHKQVQLLSGAVQPLKSELERLALNQFTTCLASNYFVVDSRWTAFSCADIAELCYVNTLSLAEEDRVRISGTFIDTLIPELYEFEGKKIKGVKDFPLSKGEPMIIIENATAQKTYFIPARAIKLFQPHTQYADPDD